MEDFEKMNKVKSGAFNNFYKQCVSELKNMTENEGIFSNETPEGYLYSSRKLFNI